VWLTFWYNLISNQKIREKMKKEELEVILKSAIPFEEMTEEQKKQYATLEKQFQENVKKFGDELTKSFEAEVEKLKAEMSNEEKISELQKSLDTITAELEKSKGNGDMTKEMEEMKSNIDSLQKSLDTVTEENKALVNEMAKIKESGLTREERKKTYVDLIQAAIIKSASRISEMNASRETLNLTQEVAKAAEDVTTGHITGSVSGLAALAGTEPEVARVQRRTPYLRQIINVRPITEGVAKWVEQEAGEGNAAPTAEGQTKNRVDQDWVTKTAKVEKITAYTKASEEIMEDIDWAAAEIANDLAERLLLAEDAQIYGGNGTTPNLKGLTAFAPAFTVTDAVNNSFYHAIPYASQIDVLRVAVALIVSNNFVPTHILLNPVDAALIDLTKAADGAYVNKSINDLLKNMTVIENTGVTAGTFLIGDMSKSNYRVRKDLGLIVARDGDDLIKNLFTFVGEIRGAHYVKSNHVNAFIKGTFADCITAITGGATTQKVQIAGPLNEAEDAVLMESKVN
jgi:HK97 family phage major capsid protein